MNSFPKSLWLLVIATLTCTAPAQLYPSVDSGNFSDFLARPELYDGLMIATVIAPAVSHPLPGNKRMAMQRVRVEDSLAFAQGTVLDIYLPTSNDRQGAPELLPKDAPIDPKNGLPLGKRVLLAGRMATQGVLRVPCLNLALPDLGDITLGSASSSVLGMVFFQTTQTRLQYDAEPKWRLLASLAAAIPNTSDANAQAVTELIAGIRLPQRYGAGGSDDRLSKLVVSAVEKDTAYHRALVDHALNELRYWGYGDRFGRDLREAASDPDAFPDGIPSLSYFEQVGNDPALPKGFKHDPPLTQSELLAILARAQSPTIAAGLLHGLTVKPSDADVRLLARFLDSPDPRPRWAMVERLCAWSGGTPPPKPTWERQEDGSVHTVETGLAEAVALWKAKLATLLP